MAKTILGVLSLLVIMSCSIPVKENTVQPNIMETNKKNLGNLLALYPKPMTVVGAEVEGKVNWLVVGHTGVIGHDRIHRFMDKMSNEARRITFRLNTAYHTPDEVRGLLSELFGYQVPSSFRVFPPFYTDFGKNITVGEGVFINACCHFQDHGGVIIGDGCQIGHNVVFATLNHGLPPEERQTTYPAPIVLGRNVWVGSNATILPGMTIGDNAVVGAGAVVTKDVEANTIVGGVPAKLIKRIE